MRWSNKTHIRQNQTADCLLPEISITTSHCVGTLFSHNRRGVIKCPAHGTRRRIRREAESITERRIDENLCQERFTIDVIAAFQHIKDVQRDGYNQQCGRTSCGAAGVALESLSRTFYFHLVCLAQHHYEKGSSFNLTFSWLCLFSGPFSLIPRVIKKIKVNP